MRTGKGARPLTDAERALVGSEAAARVVNFYALKYRRRVPEWGEDVRSAAWLGVIDAAKRYDPALGVEFGSYCAHRVVGSIKDFIRGLAPRGYRKWHERHLERPSISHLSACVARGKSPAAHGSTSFEGGEWADQLAAPDDPVGWGEESLDAVRGLCALLPRKKAAMVEAYFTRAGATMRGVADEFGVTETRVSQVVAESVRVLRGLLGVKPVADQPAAEGGGFQVDIGTGVPSGWKAHDASAKESP